MFTGRTPRGPEGLNSCVAFQGDPGPDGAAGIPGIPGEDGADGAKVSHAHILERRSGRSLNRSNVGSLIALRGVSFKLCSWMSSLCGNFTPAPWGFVQNQCEANFWVGLQKDFLKLAEETGN